jgi:demethylmenaquinone methyltransferase/2-methoxy-6-polyprenyl-1,4-benzoquinol methylase
MTDNVPKKKFIRRMFDDISDRYDLLNRIISFGLDGICRKRTIKPHSQNKIVLDICAGTGDMAIDLLNKSSFNGAIILTDFSVEMHRLALTKMKGYENVFQVICDVEKLPFKDSSVDGVISGFSLRNLGDLKALGSEIARTLTTKGTGSLVDVAHPPNPVVAKMFYLYFYKTIPLLSRLFTRKKYAYKYLPVSLRTFLKQDQVLAALKGDSLDGHYENVFFGAAAIYRLTKNKP